MKRVDELDVRYNTFDASKAITKAILKLEDCGFGADDIKDANVLCAHNLHFDKNVVFHAYKWRLNRDPLRFWPTIAEFCTMKESQDELKLPSKYPTIAEPYNRPNLGELYFHQFGEPMQHAHTAEGDVEALQRIFFSRWEYS
jgi:hypothetical protein